MWRKIRKIKRYLLDKKIIAKPKYDGQHWDLLLGCPDCGDHNIYVGPQGGMCTNICCANPFCRSAFNDMGIGNMVQRISNRWFRNYFPECPEESEAFLRTQIAKELNEEVRDFVNG